MALIDYPPNWNGIVEKSKKVDKINPDAISKAGQQFSDAAKQAGDHSAALNNSTKSLAGGVWEGPAADSFVEYVTQITKAGDKVQGHLDDVGKDLTQLSSDLGGIKSKVTEAFNTAKTNIDNRIKTESDKAQKAQTAEAEYAKSDKKGPAPSPTSQSIIDAANKANQTDATNAEQTIDPLLGQADDMVKKSQDLMKTQIEGGYSKVPLPNSDGTIPQSAGGLHTGHGGGGGGGHHGGGGGGASGGGGGLGPSGGPPSSPPPGNVQQWIQEAIKELQAAGVNVTDADIKNIWAIIQHESGGNPNAINNWDCVPLDTMVLTRRGMLKHRDVKVGDETIGFNPVTRRSEWTKITRVVHHENAPLVRLVNTRWQATTTPNHRWLTFPRGTEAQPMGPLVCPECGWVPRASVQPANGVAVHRRKIHGVRSAPARSEYAVAGRFVTTSEVGSRDRLLLSAVADTGEGLAVTVREAAILGWIAGDGHLESRQYRPTASIAQSKPDMVAKISKLLTDVPHAEYVDDRGGRGLRHQFRLDHDYVRDLLRRAGNPKSEAFSQVLAMSADQRSAWLEAITDAEGTKHLRPGYTQPKVTIYQAPGEVLDAIMLAVYLSGARPRVSYSDRTAEHHTWQVEGAVRANNPIVTGAFLREESAGRGDVWCVTTELGTWTAREGDHLFLTGNSNAAAGHPSKGLMQCIDSTFNAHKLPGHDNIYNPVDNIIAGVRYSLDRYGSMSNVPGIAAMAHGGAYRGY
ncbi:Transglycosylase SLT domain protein [Amycolatopsis sp. M39]|nr:Transglycosylase SLT domain protein [Amycolatopsis sp. M39]